MKGLDHHVVRQLAVAQNGGRPNAAVFADPGAAENLGERLDDSVHADAHIRVDSDGLGLLHGHACQHDLAEFAVAQQAVHLGEFQPVVDAQSFAGIGDTQGFHGMPGAVENRRHVGEVKLIGRIVGAQFADVLPEQVRAETIDPHVGLAERELLGCGGFLLDDFGDATARIAYDAAVAGGVGHLGSQQGSGGVRLGRTRVQHGRAGGTAGLGGDQLLKGVRPQQRAIAIQHHQVTAQARELIPPHHDGMARAFLFLLLDESDSGSGDGAAYLIGLMPDYHEDSFRRREGEGGIDYMLNQALTAGAVQYLGLPRFHARAEAGGQNYYSDGGLHLIHYG